MVNGKLFNVYGETVMITFDEIKKYNIDLDDFTAFLSKNGSRRKAQGMFNPVYYIEDDEEQYIHMYLEHLEALEQEKKEQAEALIRKQRALSQMLISSGFTFDGYKIVKYSGYISGDDVVQIPRGEGGIIFNTTADVGDALSKALRKIRRQALQELKEAAYDLGCNAIIGVDFDYITMEPETANGHGGGLYLPYVFCVTANGNAVVIEKIDD